MALWCLVVSVVGVRGQSPKGGSPERVRALPGAYAHVVMCGIVGFFPHVHFCGFWIFLSNDPVLITIGIARTEAASVSSCALCHCQEV
jgi:hypothetical protein